MVEHAEDKHGINPEHLAAEKRELDALIERGMQFPVAKRSVLRFFGKKDRTFTIQQPYLGTLDHLSAEYINMEYVQEELSRDFQEESKRLIAKNARRCARVLAIAVLNSNWKIRVLTPFLASYFLWRIQPSTLLDLVVIIQRISNMMDFTLSIRFLAITQRTTTPALVEKPENPVSENAEEDLVAV